VKNDRSLFSRSCESAVKITSANVIEDEWQRAFGHAELQRMRCDV
jgi:hypothetical protein